MATGAGGRRFADTDWVNTNLIDNPLERPPVRMSKKPIERGTMLEAKYAIEDGLDVDADTKLTDSEFGTLFGEDT